MTFIGGSSLNVSLNDRSSVIIPSTNEESQNMKEIGMFIKIP